MRIIIKLIYIVFSIVCLTKLFTKIFKFSLPYISDRDFNIIFLTILILWLFIHLFVDKNR